MAKKNKRKHKNNKKVVYKTKKSSLFSLPEDIKRLIWAIVMFLIAMIVALSFFDLAGEGGAFFLQSSRFLFGKAIFALPLFLILAGLAFWRLKYKNKWPIIMAVFLLLFLLARQSFSEGGFFFFRLVQKLPENDSANNNNGAENNLGRQ